MQILEKKSKKQAKWKQKQAKRNKKQAKCNKIWKKRNTVQIAQDLEKRRNLFTIMKIPFNGLKISYA